MPNSDSCISFKDTGSSPVAQQVKNPVLSLLWLGWHEIPHGMGATKNKIKIENLTYTHLLGGGITLPLIYKGEQYNRFITGYTTGITCLWISKYFKQIMIGYKIPRLKPLSERPRKLSGFSCSSTEGSTQSHSFLHCSAPGKKRRIFSCCKEPRGDWGPPSACGSPPSPPPPLRYLHNLLPQVPLLLSYALWKRFS